jgi:hypothetical protein
MNTGKNELFEQTPNQADPGLAKPEDFEVNPSDSNESYPFHGQRGDSKRECNALLKVREESRPKDASVYAGRPVIPNGASNTAGIKKGADNS